MSEISNPNFFLPNNRVVGYWENSELRLLCKALRFPEDLIVTYVTQMLPDENVDRVSTLKLRKLLQQSSFFRLTDVTFNNHDAAFNVPAMLRSIDLIEGRVATFAELNSIYLAYATYELQNMTGVPAEVDTLIAAFRLCGKTISPAKLQHRLKHAKTVHVRAHTVQFHEFLNLLLWALPDDFPLLPNLVPVKDRNHLGLYSIDYPESYMVPYSERVHHDLNCQYVHDEMSYTRKQVPIGSSAAIEKRYDGVKWDEWSSALALDAGITENMVKTAKTTGTVVKNEVAATAQEVRTVRAGNDHTRDISKQWLVRETSPRPPSSHMSQRSEDSRRDDAILNIPNLNAVNATQMFEILQAYMKERERRLNGLEDNPEESLIAAAPIKNNSQVKKPGVPMETIITDTDIAETQDAIKALKVEYAFMQRRRLLQQPEDDDDGKDNKEHRRTTEELITQLYNPIPLRMEAHDQQCDSRKRNIGQLNEPGVHFLLTDPSYDRRSPVGKHLTSIHNSLVGNGEFRTKTVRIINATMPVDELANKPTIEQITKAEPDQNGMRERVGSVSRKSPVDNNNWMASFIGRSTVLAALPPLDMEQYYLRKMQEFGVPLPENTAQTNKATTS